jgi:hypothetical protein
MLDKVSTRIQEARNIERQLRHGHDKIVAPQKWAAFARHCWPFKTAANLAVIAGNNTQERTAQRWLSGEFEPPGVVMAALHAKLYERE